MVVIGSGIGGMCAGALCSHAGLRTLVLERLPVLGGRFSSRYYRGFKLGTGAVGLQMGGTVQKAFEMVNAPLDINVSARTGNYINGKIHENPSRGTLQHQISKATADNDEAKRVLKAVRHGMEWMEPSPSISMREWLRQYTQNDKILGIFQQYVSSMAMLNADEIPANQWFRIAKRGTFHEIGIPPRGNLALMETLAEVVRKNNGDVRTACSVKQILVQNNTVTGVRVQGPADLVEISARAVISNAGPNKTVELAGAENFEKGYLKEIKNNMRSAPQMWIWIVADQPLFDLPLIGVGDNMRLNVVVDLTAYCPDSELAPAGKRLLVAGASQGTSPVPPDYSKELEIVMGEIRTVLPNMERHGEILLTSYYRESFPGYRTAPGSGVNEKTSVYKLYNVGDGVQIPGLVGTSVCAESARIVSEDLIQRLKKEAYHGS